MSKEPSTLVARLRRRAETDRSAAKCAPPGPLRGSLRADAKLWAEAADRIEADEHANPWVDERSGR